jgi:hypothetical protein
MRVDRVDDREAILVEVEMALDEGQDAATDGAEADQDDRAGDLAINGPNLHLRGSPAEFRFAALR